LESAGGGDSEETYKESNAVISGSARLPAIDTAAATAGRLLATVWE